MNLRRVGAVVVVMGLAVAACGKAAEVVAPRLAVREAAHSTFDDHRGRFTLSVVGDDADLSSLLQRTGDSQFLDLLRKSKIVVSVDGGDQDTLDDDRFALNLDLGNVDHAVELRMVDKTMYLRGDVAGMARLFEADASDVSKLVDGARAAGIDFVADAVAGKWLSLDLAPLEAMAKGAAGGSGGQLPEMGSPQFSKLFDAVSAAFGEDVDVTRLGQEDAGEHYRLDVALQQVYERLAPVLGELFPVPGMGALPPATEVPARQVSLDVWTSDGRIKRAELELGQFAPQPPTGRVALRVDIDGLDGGIQAPNDAVKVDVMGIFSRLMAGLGTLTS